MHLLYSRFKECGMDVVKRRNGKQTLAFSKRVVGIKPFITMANTWHFGNVLNHRINDVDNQIQRIEEKFMHFQRNYPTKLLFETALLFYQELRNKLVVFIGLLYSVEDKTLIVAGNFNSDSQPEQDLLQKTFVQDCTLSTTFTLKVKINS